MTETAKQQRIDPAAVDDLEAVLAVDEKVIATIAPDQMSQPTPCPDFDVAHEVEHVVNGSQDYAARLTGEQSEEHSHDYRRSDDPASRLRANAASIVAAYRGGSPGTEVLPLDVLLMEFLAHGWDLAVATEQQARFPESAAERALTSGRRMLTLERRGTSFGPPVEPPEDASSVEQLVAFLGRDPRWNR